eukprot:317208_1
MTSNTPTTWEEANIFFRRNKNWKGGNDVIYIPYEHCDNRSVQAQIRLMKDIKQSDELIKNSMHERRRHYHCIHPDIISQSPSKSIPFKFNPKQLEISVRKQKIQFIMWDKCQKYFNALISFKLSEKNNISNSNICLQKDCIHQLIDMEEIMSLTFDAITDITQKRLATKYFCFQLVMHHFAIDGIYLCKYCIDKLCNYNKLIKTLHRLRSHCNDNLLKHATLYASHGCILQDGSAIKSIYEAWFDCIYSETMIIITLYYVAKHFPKMVHKLVKCEFNLFYFTMQRLFKIATQTYCHKKYGFDDKNITKVYINEMIGKLDIKYIDLHELLRYVWITVIGKKSIKRKQCLEILKKPSSEHDLQYSFHQTIGYHYANSHITLDKTKKDTLFPSVISMSIVYNYCYQQLSRKQKRIVGKQLFDFIDIGFTQVYPGCGQNIILPIWAMLFDENYKIYDKKCIFGKKMNELIMGTYRNERKYLQCSNPKCNKTQNTTTFQMCERCRLRRYCSRKCQKIHWKYEHRHSCLFYENKQ